VKQGDKICVGKTLTSSTGAISCIEELSGHTLRADVDAWKSAAPMFKRRGVGVACLMHAMGYGTVVPDFANAKIELTDEGKIRIYSGYAMGLFLGLGWGVAMPVLSGLVFDVSAAKFRALNTNLAFEMFQAGFFVGPLAGAAILVHWGYQALYYACAGLSSLGLIAALALCSRQRSGA
jgi:hypothetical protein